MELYGGGGCVSQVAAVEGKSLITFRRFIDPPSQMYGIFIIRFRPPYESKHAKERGRRLPEYDVTDYLQLTGRTEEIIHTKSFYKLMIFFLSTATLQ